MGVKGEARIQWNEKARVQVIQAVIQVESDILNHANQWALLSTRRLGEKWERINNLLPPELQGTASSRHGRNCDQHKCRRGFGELLKAYSDPLPNRQKGPVRYALTKPVREIMKKREDLLNAGISNHTNSTLTLGTSNEISPSACSVNDSRRVPSTSCQSDLNMHTNQERSSERQSKRTASPRTAPFLSEHVNESTEEARYFNKKAKRIEMSQLNRMGAEERHNLGYFSGCASRYLSAGKGSKTHKLASPTLGPPSRCPSDFQECGDMVEPSELPEDQSQAHLPTRDTDLNSSTGLPCYHLRASSSVRKSTPRRLPRRHI